MPPIYVISGKRLIVRPLTIPIMAPDTIPDAHRNGRYHNNLDDSRIIIATRICPTLCMMPPATLMATTCKDVNFFNRTIVIKDRMAPLMAYNIDTPFPNVMPTINTRIRFNTMASMEDSLYKATTMTRLVNPNFIPGMATKAGIWASI